MLLLTMLGVLLVVASSQALYAGWVGSRARRRYRYDGLVTHEVVVDPDDAGGPGERVVAPSEPAHLGFVHPGDTARQDFGVFIGRRSILQTACLRRSEALGPARSAAERAVAALGGTEETLLSPLSVSSCAGEPAVTYTLRTASGRVLTEYHFQHSGWQYAVGLLVHPDDEPGAGDRARATLSTWVWIEAPTTGEAT